MKSGWILVAILAAMHIATVSAEESEPSPQNRCGWFDNPSPGNISLIDRDGEWVIGIQGNYQVKDEWSWPKFKKSDWVADVAGGHGHGCACLKVTVNKNTQEITRIYSATPKPLNTCRKDRAIKEP